MSAEFLDLFCMCACLQGGMSLLYYAVDGGSIELVDWLAERHNLNIYEWDRVSFCMH